MINRKTLQVEIHKCTQDIKINERAHARKFSTEKHDYSLWTLFTKIILIMVKFLFLQMQ